MYVLRCTRTLWRDTDGLLERASENTHSSTRLGDWYAIRLNVGPQRYVLATNATSLLSVVVAAKDLRQLPVRIASGLDRLLAMIGVPDAARADEIARMGSARTGRASSRSVLASMGWLAVDADMELRDVPHRPGRSLDHVNAYLAHVPMGALQHRAPAEVALTLLAGARPVRASGR